MDFLSILSSLPGLKFDFSKTFNIHIGRDYISQNGKTIGGEQEIKKILDELKKSKNKDSLPIQLINKDQEKELSQTENKSLKNSEIKLLKENLPKEEIKPILLAKAIHNSILKKESKETINKLIETLENAFPKKGKRILNLLTAGYFDELIIPMISLCNGDKNKNFKEFYLKLINFHPTAIFVNKDTTIPQIHTEIKKRLKQKTIPQIKIHAIGKENIQTKNKSINSLDVESKIEINKIKKTNPIGTEEITIIKIIKNFE